MIYYVYDSYYLAKSFGRATSLPARSAEMPRFPLSMPTAPSKLKTYLFHVDRQTKEPRMSDDSSDSDSDDDLLLGAPTFNRGQSRRQKVADRRKLDFLDEVVKTQEKKSDQNERIASKIRQQRDEIRKEQEKAEAVGTTALPAGAPAVYGIGDEDLWERVDAAVEATVGRGGGAVGAAKRRREIQDAVEGIDELSSDEELDCGELNDPEAQKRRKKLASARTTGMSTLLGTRATFVGPGRRQGDAKTGKKGSSGCGAGSSPFSFSSSIALKVPSSFSSPQEARATLTATIAGLMKSRGRPGKKLKALRDSILSDLEAANEAGEMVLCEYLDRSTLAQQCVDKALPIPAGLFAWLFAASCSGGRLVTVSISAFHTLVKIINLQVKVIDCIPGSSDLKVMNLSALCDGLEYSYGLWTLDTPVSSRKEDKSKKRLWTGESSLGDIIGLQHYLTIWTTAIDKGYISTEATFGEVLSEATKILSALARAGLDPVFHSGKCALVEARDSLFLSLTEHTVRSMHSIESEADEQTKQFFVCVADSVCRACFGLESGPDGSADNDDDEGWLPLSLAIRSIPVDRSSGVAVMDAIQLKAAVVERALRKSLGDPDDWESRIQEAFESHCKSSEDRSLTTSRRLMAATEVGFRRLQSTGEEITSNGPRYLSTIELVAGCAEISMAMFSDVVPSPDGTGGIYGSVSEADFMCRCLESLEELCSELKKSIRTSVFAFPHLRRVKDILNLYGVYFRHLKVEASAYAQHKGEVNLKQRTLEAWVPSDSHMNTTKDETLLNGLDSEGSRMEEEEQE